MNDCNICGGPIDWSALVGEYDLREWHLNRAIAEKGWICKTCLASLQDHIASLKDQAKV